MRVLVTGACGLLGAHVMAALQPRHQVTGLDRHPWWGDQPGHVELGDLQDEAFLDRTVRAVAPQALVHCAAMTDVDACERDPQRAYAINAGVTAALVRAAGPSCRVAYVSTDSLFAGDRAWVVETEAPCPRTVYARSKLHGEWEVVQGGGPALVVRTNLYGWSSGRKKTFGEWLYGALDRGEAITLYDDIYTTPIYVVDLAHRIVELLEGGHTAVVNVCGADRVSKYDFGMRLARVAGLSTDRVTRGGFGDRPAAARRPKDMSLSSARYEALTGRRAPSCDEGLARFVADRHQPLSARVAYPPRLSSRT
jgi:dTDP-4-dehydrorhamnose reductase